MRARKPQWWQLYLLVPTMFALMVLEQLAPLPGVSIQIVDMGLTVLTFATILLWVKENEAALGHGDSPMQDQSLRDFKITVLNHDSAIHRDDEPLRDHARSATARPTTYPPTRRVAMRSGDKKRTLP